MHLKQPITLPILWKDSAAIELEKLGLDHSLEPEIKMVCFFSIDHIYETKLPNMICDLTAINSGGYDYIAKVNYQTILDKIKNENL